MNTLEILKAARAKIDDPENWHQGDWAEDVVGNDCRWDNPKACRWCALGAASSVLGRDLDDRHIGALSMAVSGTRHDGLQAVIKFNDHPSTTHADVLALFDRAIAAEEAKAGAE